MLQIEIYAFFIDFVVVRMGQLHNSSVFAGKLVFKKYLNFENVSCMAVPFYKPRKSYLHFERRNRDHDKAFLEETILYNVASCRWETDKFV